MKKTSVARLVRDITFLLSCFLVILVFLAPHVQAYTRDECIHCHQEGAKGSVLQIPVKRFEASVHHGLACWDCHVGVRGEDHQRVKGSGLVYCGQCHDQVNRHGLSAGDGKRPECASCHTSHAILGKDQEDSSVHPKRLSQTCRSCHPFQAGERDYLSWFPSLQIKSHGKGDFARQYDRGNCLGCHQGQAAHGEENPINAEDCYKCHLPQKDQAGLWGYIHPRADASENPWLFGIALLYQGCLAALLWGGFKFFIGKFSGRKKG